MKDRLIVTAVLFGVFAISMAQPCGEKNYYYSNKMFGAALCYPNVLNPVSNPKVCQFTENFKMPCHGNTAFEIIEKDVVIVKGHPCGSQMHKCTGKRDCCGKNMPPCHGSMSRMLSIKVLNGTVGTKNRIDGWATEVAGALIHAGYRNVGMPDNTVNENPASTKIYFRPGLYEAAKTIAFELGSPLVPKPDLVVMPQKFPWGGYDIVIVLGK